ncbi:MAG: helix-turn-helix domain-containing protein [Clostridia bacterium]|nr:helix-turn-helix domain-containing protein [Clostridia bacterium]
MTFSENLKRCKDERGYTIEELSRRSGVPVGTLSKLLSGVIAEPKMAVVLALAKGLSCSLSHLLDPAGEHIEETLDEEERAVLASYRRLDTHSRELVRMVMEKQLSYVSAAAEDSTAAEPKEEGARILSLPKAQTRTRKKSARVSACDEDAIGAQKRANVIPLYDLPASAGVGEFLDSARASREITLPPSDRREHVDYAVTVNGDSMEPRFVSGDLLLVQKAQTLDAGDFGVFLLDGTGYVKQYAGDRLHSLNPAYDDILLSDYEDVRCVGRVVSKLSRKSKNN